MKAQQIFDELRKKEISYDHFFGRKLVLLKYNDFKKYEKYFEKIDDIFNDKINYRTKGKIKHIHAVRDKDLVQFHMDYGNVSRNKIYGIIHLFSNVIPYFTWHLITWKKPYEVRKK